MTKGNILIATSSFAGEAPELIESLKKAGYRTLLNPYGRTLGKPELRELLQQHRPIGLLAGTEPIDRELLNSSVNFLKVISRVGVGWDNIDREAAAMLGIRVFRTPGVLTQAVAELTVGLILSALRKISLHDRLVRDKKWEKHMGALLEGKTVGLIGFGEIGQRVGKLLLAFGVSILYYDPRQTLTTDDARPVSMAELLAQSDILSLHASGNGVILNSEALRCCKRGVLLVNTARGGLVDEDALAESLKDGQVGFACLDVFAREPYVGPLSASDHVLLTPHIGSYAREARIKMEAMAVENLLAGLKEVSRS